MCLRVLILAALFCSQAHAAKLPVWLYPKVPAWVTVANESTDFDFINNRCWSPASGQQLCSVTANLSLTRASTGMAQWADGHWDTFTSGALRITDQGLLIEDARTNLFLNSAAPVTQTITIGATGNYTLTCWGSSGTAVVAAGTATGSGFGTATASTTGGKVTFTITGTGTITITVSGSPLYVQVEAGSFGTSPIITTGTSATRAADVLNLSGPALRAFLVSQASEFETNLGEGITTAGRLFIAGLMTGSYVNTTTAQMNNGSFNFTTAFGSGSYSGLGKVAFAYDGTSFTAIANGGTKGSTANAWGTMNGAVVIGNISGGSRCINAYLRRMRVGPVKGMFDGLTQ